MNFDRPMATGNKIRHFQNVAWALARPRPTSRFFRDHTPSSFPHTVVLES